jgi:hypothetical protein
LPIGQEEAKREPIDQSRENRKLLKTRQQETIYRFHVCSVAAELLF